jgi:hypothetical protein
MPASKRDSKQPELSDKGVPTRGTPVRSPQNSPVHADTQQGQSEADRQEAASESDRKSSK